MKRSKIEYRFTVGQENFTYWQCWVVQWRWHIGVHMTPLWIHHQTSSGQQWCRRMPCTALPLYTEHWELQRVKRDANLWPVIFNILWVYYHFRIALPVVMTVAPINLVCVHLVQFTRVDASLHRRVNMFFPVEWYVEQWKQYRRDIIEYSEKHISTTGGVNITVPLAVTNVGHYITTRDAKLDFLNFF